MSRKAKTLEELAAFIATDSAYARAAARWVADHNKENLGWFQERPEAGLFNADFISDVTFNTVGAYYYSEMTFDEGSAGISYTFWEPFTRKGVLKYKAIPYMEIRWYDGMNAGKFIEECVALL